MTDPALLVSSLLPKQVGPPTRAYSYMPHFRNANRAWESVCRTLGFGYIDPRNSPQAVIDDIRRSRVVITEAMHGAIVADALGVPWIPIKTAGPGVLDFKWRDWCGSLRLLYRPYFLVPLYASTTGLKLVAKSSIAAAQLLRIAHTAEPQLSDDSLRHLRLSELQHRLEVLKSRLKQERTDPAMADPDAITRDKK